MKKVFPLLVFSLIAMTSCTRSKVVTCDTGMFSIVGVGFSDSDFNGATISQYESGSGFSKVAQSGSVTYNIYVNDSGNVIPGSVAAAHTPNEIPTTYDYVISMPTTGINDTISNVTFLGPAQETISYDWPVNDEVLQGCSNPVVSYTFNGQVITNASGQALVTIYIVK